MVVGPSEDAGWIVAEPERMGEDGATGSVAEPGPGMVPLTHVRVKRRAKSTSQTDDPSMLSLQVKGREGNIVHFKVKRCAQLGAVMDAYRAQQARRGDE